MDISNPRRILAVSLADSVQHLTRVIKDLTGSFPEQESTSLAGSSHNLTLKTAYYTAEVPIWLDLISSPDEWAGSFLSPEAKEVLEALGGFILVFSLPVKSQSDEGKATRDFIEKVGKVVQDGLGGWSWDGVGLCLGIGETDDFDEWEDFCSARSLEYIQVRSQSTPTRNEFGEKTGIPRALEALEANDWSQAAAARESDLEDFEAELGIEKDTDGKEKDDPGLEPLVDSTLYDFLVTKDDGNAGGDDSEELNDEAIQKLEGMITKLQVVRDSNAGLPEDQRRRAAAKAVAEVMKEI
ncbi:uncharacterized protein F4822DRAFT_397486 [Hypoxylon trugodes]|uniref:uncharacterized protein n=1 Tax=Hypoxylon trugodes TaxID=326681 RepID=UPI002192CA3D|nr:uncharacterized protein F4822DRAFT_397486 [Hypoxylon trugodes]KAI1391694.1 hypothetical protein F4822DRAFT_397486 [Hypoxylon trugodes]